MKNILNILENAKLSVTKSKSKNLKKDSYIILTFTIVGDDCKQVLDWLLNKKNKGKILKTEKGKEYND